MTTDMQVIDHETGEIMTAPIIFIPSPQDALDAWNAYQELCKKLLTDSDYATIKGRKARKRTAWAKLRRALNISTAIIQAEWEEFDEGDCGYLVTVRASFPDGRFEDGDGYCDSYELRTGNIAPTRHNIRAKAVTRAKNRATADVIGSGEVSAEEFVENDEHPVSVPQRTSGNGTEEAKTAFFARVLAEVAYYEHTKHIANTLKKLGFTGYNRAKEDEMFTALEAHANEAANQEAA
jgi:hypothetical protein